MAAVEDIYVFNRNVEPHTVVLAGSGRACKIAINRVGRLPA